MAGLVLACGLAALPAQAGSYTDAGSGGTSPAVITPAATSTSYSAPQGATAYSSVTPMSPDGIPTYTKMASSSQLTPRGSTDTSSTATGSNTVPALAFYDSAAESLTITCAVTVQAPDGTTLNLTASYPHTAGQAGAPTHAPTSDPPQWTVVQNS